MESANHAPSGVLERLRVSENSFEGKTCRASSSPVEIINAFQGYPRTKRRRRDPRLAVESQEVVLVETRAADR
jgi:hypothetical protein